MPDVCFTPPENPATPPGVPVPYPNSAFDSDTTDGSKSTGPSWKELWKRDHKFSSSNESGYGLSAGDADEKWEAYLTESMLNPGAKVVEGYNNQMPSYAGQLNGPAVEGFSANDEKRRAIIEYFGRHPLEGYRRLTFMMLDEDVVAESPASTYDWIFSRHCSGVPRAQ